MGNHKKQSSRIKKITREAVRNTRACNFKDPFLSLTAVEPVTFNLSIRPYHSCTAFVTRMGTSLITFSPRSVFEKNKKEKKKEKKKGRPAENSRQSGVDDEEESGS